MSDQKVLKKRLKALMGLPENQVCSDCTERQPRWASLIVPPPGAPEGSLPIGAFCCLECSGSHRRLGVHISFVRSINLDSWKEREVLAMENGGNAKVNAIFEANLNREKPTNHADLQTRERYIRDKYERRKFYNPSAFGTFRPSAPSAPAPAPKEIALPALAPTPVGAPSEVAQRRIEERRRRNQGMTPKKDSQRQLRRVGSSDSVVKKAKKPSRKTKEESVDLLDFSAPPSDPAPAANPATDLFGFLEVKSDKPATPHETFSNSFVNGSANTKAAADIMALYGNSGSTFGVSQPQQPQGYNNGMNATGMNAMAHQMGQMNLNNNNNMWSPQQQQKQQMMMMQQQQMRMMMMQQQQQRQQQGNYNAPMMNGNFNMMGGNMMGQQQSSGFGNQMMGGRSGQQATTQPEDPFASLGGRNTFR